MGGEVQMKKLGICIGDRFGRLVVISEPFSVKSPCGQLKRKVICKCDCGVVKEYYIDLIRRGHTKSCGCYNIEQLSKNKKMHGLYGSRIYNIYRAMIDRCYNHNAKRYQDYCGRGILVCKEWKENVESFKEWALNNGYKDNLTIDRIDNNGIYEPNNCRWTTMKEQGNNRRNSKLYSLFGKDKTLSQWCEIYNKKYELVKGRMRIGWSLEKTLTYEHKN